MTWGRHLVSTVNPELPSPLTLHEKVGSDFADRQWVSTGNSEFPSPFTSRENVGSDFGVGIVFPRVIPTFLTNL